MGREEGYGVKEGVLVSVGARGRGVDVTMVYRRECLLYQIARA